jgi:glycosyltransferase involved in cell wall biosynthesis
VDFFLMGKAHHEPPGAWVPDGLPPNVMAMGHVEGETRDRILAGAWALVNTSIHEALPVSFVEAFAVKTPVISCQDPGGLVSRFGTYVGRFDGTGIDAVDPIAGAVRALTPETVDAVGARARSWVIEAHSPRRFRQEFLAACRPLRVPASSDSTS